MKKKYIFLTAIFGFINAFAMPANPVIVSGKMVSETPCPKQMHISALDKTIINWDSFSIEKGENVRFFQANNMSSVLNRVTGNTKSEIFGTLQSNGYVFLINPQGVIIGKNAVIDTSSFLASTLDISDQDFINQNYLFAKAGVGGIINYGKIKTSIGAVTLLSRKVENHGEIISNTNFDVGIAEEILLQNDQENRVFIRAKLIDEENAGFSNLGKIAAIQTEIQASNNPYSYAINLQGEITKPTSEGKGKFYLKAEGAKIIVGGKITQNEIAISGQEIQMEKTANIDAGKRGIVDFAVKDKLTTNGICKAPSGFISMVKQESDSAFLHHGCLDVSAPEPGKIYLHTTYLLNTGKLLANSDLDKGGEIQIEALKIIDVQKAQISANGKKIGGKIQVMGAERLSTSGRYIATGKEKGGKIKTRSNNLVLISPHMDASSERINGDIQLEVAENGKYFSLSHTKLLGEVSNKKVPVETLLNGFAPVIEEDIPSRLLPLKIVKKTQPLFEEKLLTKYIEPVKEEKLNTATSIDVLSRRNSVDDVGNIEESSSTIIRTENKLLSASLGAPLLGAEVPFDEYELIDPNFGSGTGFGTLVVALSTGNIVVTKPNDDSNGHTASGAVYLYDGTTRAVISTLIGSNDNDEVGLGGAYALTNGNYVVASPVWDNGLITNVGAATWGSGITGVDGEINAANSLMGSQAGDLVGNGGVLALPNGSYVVLSPFWADGVINDAGAATWCPSTGLSGPVTTGNSLYGTTLSDEIGSGGGVVLADGSYVILNPEWSNAGNKGVGSATWCPSTGLTGPVTTGNSLYGTLGGLNPDNVGSGGVLALPNGSYVVLSPDWASNNGGAATWCPVGGLAGPVATANSLYGGSGDHVGSESGIALKNGNYVICTSSWNDGIELDNGAATFCKGDGTTVGLVSTTNSLYGARPGDNVGIGGAVELANGDYVVISYNWNEPTGALADVGAVTWCSGTTGIPYNESTVGAIVSYSNSLYGALGNDRIGSDGVTALTNGNYVVCSHSWNKSILAGESFLGAATLCQADGSTIGPVTTTNSLYGTVENDHVGYLYGLVPAALALTNGNYVVFSPDWNMGGLLDNGKGAITWADGNLGITGEIDTSNSIIGTNNGDRIGYVDATNYPALALVDGNYFVASKYYMNGALDNAGAATVGDGSVGTVGAISTSNSLIGLEANTELTSITADSVNYSVVAGFWKEGTGRVRIAYLPKPPTPPTPPSFEVTEEQITQINNFTTSSRNEMFTTFHPYTDFLGKYLTFYNQEKIPSMKISLRKGVGDRFYLENVHDYKIWQRKVYFLRQRMDKTQSLQEEKTL